MTGLGQDLLAGFATALTPTHLAFGLAGVTLGTAVGVLPGIGPALAISMLMPLTFGLDPIAAFIMFGGIYYGAMYGGSTTAILIRMPGEASSVVTALDGHALTRQGRAGAALATAALGSFVAGTFATLMLMLTAPWLVEVALRFGPAEYFALMVLALTAATSLSGDAPARGAVSLLIGLALGTIGIDLQTGQARFTFGVPGLLAGIDVVMVTVGLFAVGEVLWHAAGGDGTASTPAPVRGRVRLTAEEWRRSVPAWVRGTLVGFFTGVLPGAGATLASFLSYDVERRLAPDRIGRGAIEGVAGPEAANNASAGGSLVPLLALGIPGSGTTAVLLAAFQMYGLQPGPLLFEQASTLTWSLIASLYLSNALLLILNLPLIGLWVRLLRVPAPLLYALVLAFSTLGVYTMNRSLFDVGIVCAIGGLGFFMRRYGFPVAPTVMAVVIGPLMEQELRRALAVSGGDPSVFVTRPIAGTVLLLAAGAALGPWWWRHRPGSAGSGR